MTWNDDVAVELAHHLNFYMTYFDNATPYIIIHTPESETASSQEVTRFPFGTFPATINARALDENLIQFWIASREGDPVRRYIYNYQIIEYAATYHIEENVRRAIRRSIAAPNAQENIDKITQQIVDAMGETKLQDPQKIEALIKQVVDPALIWAEIDKNVAFFSQPTTFEGGFVLQSIARVGWSLDDFKVGWCPAFPNAIRLIRNALSHGRERSGAVILPTTGNFRLLQNWVPLVAAAAREVMIYRDIA